MRANRTYAFDVNLSDTASFGRNRFQLVIRQNPALAVHLLDFTAAKAAGGAEIKWKTENEENYTNFTVEKSIDNGKTFNVLGGSPSNAGGSYSLLDKNPFMAVNQYRLKLQDLNGTTSNSNVVSLLYSALSSNSVNDGLSVYPNPTNGVLKLTIDQAFESTAGLVTTSVSNPISGADDSQNAATVYNIKIFNSMGSVVKVIETLTPYWQGDVSNLPPGQYIIHVVNDSNKAFVGQSTFIKL